MVVSRARVLDVVRAHPDWAVLSMSDAHADPVDLGAHAGPVYRTFFDDMTHAAPSAIAAGFRPPSIEDATGIVRFLGRLRELAPPGLVVHCVAGVSRSTASVLAAGALLRGPAAALDILDAAVESAARAGFRAGDSVHPNSRLGAMFDDLLELRGALLGPALQRFWPHRSIDEVYRDARG